jgi:hypothetical protein
VVAASQTPSGVWTGLMGEGGHTVLEAVDVTTLSGQTKREAVRMYRLRNPELPGT